MNLRTKFITSFFIVGIIPLILMGLVSVYLINLTNKYNIASQETNLLVQKNDEIESFMEEIAEGMRIKVGYEVYEPIALKDQEFLLQGILDVMPEVEEAAFLAVIPDILPEAPKGQSREREGDKKFKIGQETRKLARYQDVFHTINSEDLIDKSFSEQFKTAKEGKDYFSQVYWTLSGPMITVALPIYNKSDQIISVISIEVNLTNIQKKIIAQSRLGSDGYIFVVDSNGKVLAHSGRTDAIGNNISNIPIVKSTLKGSLVNPFDNEGNYVSHFGDKVIASAGFMPDFGWGVIVEWPENDAFATVRDISAQVLIFSLLALVIVTVFGMFMAKRILDPLKKLKIGAKKIGGGKFDHVIDIETKDELEELGKEFNEMAKGLKRLEELKNEFVFVAAHELRTPVTAIKGYISMLLEGDAGKLPDEVAQYLSKTNNANERLVQLVNDLLEIARNEAGRLEITVSPQDLVENIKTIADELKPLIDEKNIKFKYEHKEKALKVLADGVRLKEVLINLVGNAIKYNKEGGSLEISHEIKGNSVITHVKDSGFGMSREDLSHLFEKFWRSESKDIRKQGGTGLGLFITKELVVKMGGKIWAKSQKGTGSTFSFSLPISR